MKRNIFIKFIGFIVLITAITVISPTLQAQSNACSNRCLMGGSANDCPLYGLVSDGTVCQESGRAGILCKCPAALTTTPQPTLTSIVTPKPTSVGLTKDGSLSFDKRAIQVKPGETFDVQIVVNAGSNKIIGLDSVLNVDKTLIEFQSKKDGVFFPTVVQTESGGKLTVSGIVEDPNIFKTGSGVLATLTFKALKEGSNSISYFCSSSGSEGSKIIANNDNGDDVLDCSKNTKVLFMVSTQSVSPVPSGPVPSQPASCLCKADNTCDSSCIHSKNVCTDENKCSYADSIKCSRESSLGAAPSESVKNDYCGRYVRLKGDADGDDTVNNLDYLYYVRTVNGGAVPEEINPDFNGDGLVSPSDREIIVMTLGESVTVPSITTTPAPTSSETQPTPTATTVTPSTSPTNSTARPTLVQPTLATQQCSTGFTCLTQTECQARRGAASGISCGATLFCCYTK